MKVLFICRGNVARSQMAEAIFADITKGKHESFSAGTKVVGKDGTSRHGQKLGAFEAGQIVIEALKDIGIDASSKVRTQLDQKLIEEADVVICMAEQETIPEYLSASNKVEYWDVLDPKDTPADFHKNIRDRIREHVLELVKRIDG